MYKINHVEIKRFWDDYMVKTPFNPDVNIFISPNGTGKTTLINIIQAALSLDVEMLEKLVFSKITIKLIKGKQKRTIQVLKYKSIRHIEIDYKISNKIYPVHRIDYHRKRRGISHLLFENYKIVKDKLKDLIKLRWLSVHRDIIELRKIDNDTDEKEIDLINSRIDELMLRFKEYLLKLQTEANNCSTEFQQNVLVSILFDEKIDKIIIDNKIFEDLNKRKEELIKVYNELGIPEQNAKPKIDETFKEIISASKNIIKRIKNEEKTNSDSPHIL